MDAFAPAARFTFVAVVAVDEFPTNVPKKLVAVAAVADKFPENTPAVRTFVLGLYAKSASAEVAKPLPLDAGENVI